MGRFFRAIWGYTKAYLAKAEKRPGQVSIKNRFQLRKNKGETYVNFKNFVGPVFIPQKRFISHFYMFAYFCQICFADLVVKFQLYLNEYRNLG